MTTTPHHYVAPGWFTRHVLNGAVRTLARLGLSVWGSRVLEVPGRTTGARRRTPVNLLVHDGRRFLVSPRGEGHWVRNVRANGGRLDLLLGRRRAGYVSSELAGGAKVEVLRAYLRRWRAEVGVFFGGVDAASSDTDLLAVAHRHPVFELTPVDR
jgi:hypothetical protein